MGEIADMLADTFFDMGDYDPTEEDYYCIYPKRKSLRCRHCNKGKLKWRQIQGKWIMFELNGSPHCCHGYEPPFEILKELAKEVTAEAKENFAWRMMDKTKKRGGLVHLIPCLNDKELLDLYDCFIRDEQLHAEEVGMPVTYEHEIELLREAILERMKV